MLRYVQACETKDSSGCYMHIVVKKSVKYDINQRSEGHDFFSRRT